MPGPRPATRLMADPAKGQSGMIPNHPLTSGSVRAGNEAAKALFLVQSVALIALGGSERIR